MATSICLGVADHSQLQDLGILRTIRELEARIQTETETEQSVNDIGQHIVAPTIYVVVAELGEKTGYAQQNPEWEDVPSVGLGGLSEQDELDLAYLHAQHSVKIIAIGWMTCNGFVYLIDPAHQNAKISSPYLGHSGIKKWLGKAFFSTLELSEQMRLCLLANRTMINLLERNSH